MAKKSSPTHGRLLIVSLSPALGGAERSMLLLASYLPDYGWEAVLACPSGELAGRAQELGIAVEPTSWQSVNALSRRTATRKRYALGAFGAAVVASLRNAMRTTALARRVGADILLSNSLHAHPFVAMGGRFARRPVIWHMRDIIDPGPGRDLLKVISHTAHGVLAVSRAVASAIPHRSTLVVPNPVEIGSEAHPREASHRVVGFIGRLDPEKGLNELIQAAALVEASFVVVGEPCFAPRGYLDELKRAAERRAPGRLRFVGSVPDPGEVLSGFTVLVVPSRREPFGRVAAEALSCGIPVVAAATGGLPEVVRDGVDGLLYPAGDVVALADRVRRLLDDRELHVRMSTAARAGSGRFLPSHHAHQVAGYLDTITNATVSGHADL